MESLGCRRARAARALARGRGRGQHGRGLAAAVWAVALPVAAVLLLLGGGAGPVAAQTSTSGPCSQAMVPGDHPLTVVSGGLQRTAVVHVPPVPAGEPVPVVIGLHGAGAGFFETDSGLSVIGDAEGFIAVYPNPTQQGGRGFWNINDDDPRAPNDVQFISDMLTQMEGQLCIDTQRVYALGVSNGGGMAARLACQLSSRIAGIASIAGGYKSLPACHPTNPVTVVEVHGTNDGTVPYDGSPPARTGAVVPWLTAWAQRDRCRRNPVSAFVAPRVERYDWVHCAGGTAVEHFEVFGGEHQLPGGIPPDSGPASTISATWLAWSFLRQHRLAVG